LRLGLIFGVAFPNRKVEGDTGVNLDIKKSLANMFAMRQRILMGGAHKRLIYRNLARS
jgi:hypothetical protein